LVAPTLLIVSLAGYGAAFRAVFVRGFRDQSREWDLFECAFAGIFLIAAGVLAANFFIELGINPGPYVLTTGIALFVIFKLWNKISLTQLILVVFVVSIISAKLRYIPLSFDAGLYHISSMNWVAYQARNNSATKKPILLRLDDAGPSPTTPQGQQQQNVVYV
jgi:hypothetical protein